MAINSGSAMDRKARSYVNFDKQDYFCDIVFGNGSREISLNAQSIMSLEIRENLLNWYIEGEIILNNPYEQFERNPLKQKVPTEIETPLDKLDYGYRGDGRDIIQVRIKPDLNSRADSLPQPQPNTFPNEVWEIYFEGVLYSVEDLESTGPSTKLKKFYFIEKEYQVMLEKNIEFTTSNVGRNEGQPDINKISNLKRSLPTGEALLELFKSVPEFEGKIDEDKWSLGDLENCILYTSPSSSKLKDDVDYIIQDHTDGIKSDFDTCFLKFDRRKSISEPKKFTFLSLFDYFNRAGKDAPGEYQTEYFTIAEMGEVENGGNDSSDGIRLKKSPEGADITNPDRNVRAFSWNEITTYKFEEMRGMDSAKLIACKGVYSYHPEQGQFNFDIKDNTPEKAKLYQEDNYLPNVTTGQGGGAVRLQLNEYKKNGYNFSPEYNRSGQAGRKAFGRNKILQAALFNGTAINFEVKGLTSRQPGRFMSINKFQQNDNDFDDRLEGQYLVTNITHSFDFETMSYRNDILGVKFHKYRNGNQVLKEDDDTILLKDTIAVTKE